MLIPTPRDAMPRPRLVTGIVALGLCLAAAGCQDQEPDVTADTAVDVSGDVTDSSQPADDTTPSDVTSDAAALDTAPGLEVDADVDDVDDVDGIDDIDGIVDIAGDDIDGDDTEPLDADDDTGSGGSDTMQPGADAADEDTSQDTTAAVDTTCTPDCGLSCGGTDPVCGEPCVCDASALCIESLCVDADTLNGNTCETRATMTLQGTGLTVYQPIELPATNELEGVTCGGATAGDGADFFYRAVALTDGSLRFSLSTQQGDDARLLIFAGDACDAASCVDGVDLVGATGQNIVVPAVSAGDVFTAVVDIETPGATGIFQLWADTVCTCEPNSCGVLDSCGLDSCQCQPGFTCGANNVCEAPPLVAGDTCDAPFDFSDDDGDGVYSGSGNTAAADVSASQDTTGCPQLGVFNASGAAARDQVWSFTADAGGNYLVEVLSGAGVDHFVTVFDGSGCTAATCLGYDDTFAAGLPETFVLNNLMQGQTVSIVVDSWKDDLAGPYTITVAPYCEPVCAAGSCGVPDGCGSQCECTVGSCDVSSSQCVALTGDTCEDPFELVMTSPTLYTGTGNLWLDQGFESNYGAGTCPGLAGSTSGDNAIDNVWRFTVPTTGDWLIEAQSLDDIQLYLYPGADCSDGCVDRSDIATSGQNSLAEALLLSATAGDVVHIVVDSVFGLVGDYTLQAELTP